MLQRTLIGPCQNLSIDCRLEDGTAQSKMSSTAGYYLASACFLWPLTPFWQQLPELEVIFYGLCPLLYFFVLSTRIGLFPFHALIIPIVESNLPLSTSLLFFSIIILTQSFQLLQWEVAFLSACSFAHARKEWHPHLTAFQNIVESTV